MIRTNLATRPFYNERAVRLVLVALAVVALGATAFNVTRIVQLSRRDTRLATDATRDEARTDDTRQRAARLRATVDSRVIEAASADARQANDLIDRRTFSWTELFNQIETTLPDDVRITAFQPRRDKGRTVLAITVVARTVNDISQFMDKLEGTGAFRAVGSRVQERVNEEGMLAATLEVVYLPSAAQTDKREPR